MLQYFVLVCLLVTGTVSQGNQGNGNGIDNLHVDGTDGVTKLEVGMMVSMQNAGEEALSRVDVWAWERDTAMAYTDGRTGDLTHFYQGVHFLNAQQYFNGERESEENQCPLARLDTTTPYNTLDRRLMTYTISTVDLSADATLIACGMLVSGNFLYAVIRAQRIIGVDHEYDQIKVLSWPLDKIIVRTLVADDLIVGMPPKLDIVRRWEVTMKLYTTETLVQQTFAPSVPSANVALIADGGTIDLGDTAYLELCLDIPASSGFQTYFTASPITPVGAYLYDLELVYTYLTEGIPVDTSPIELLGPDSCPVGEMIWYSGTNNDAYALKWFPDDDALTINDKQRAPNCMRTRNMEVSIPSKRYSNDIVSIVLRANIGYCFTTTDQKCFWDGTGAAPGCSRRRRRQAEQDKNQYDPDWPTKVKGTYKISNPDAGIITVVDVERTKQGCLEKKTFFAIAIVLGILLLIVFAVALAMFVKIRSYPSDQGSSVEGFHNKAYYN